MKILDWIYLPFQAFLAFPPLAIIIGVVFCVLCRGRVGGRGAAIIAGVWWMVYGAYECYMTWIWSPPRVAPIRADLLLVAPILYMLSLLAVFSLWSSRKK